MRNARPGRGSYSPQRLRANSGKIEALEYLHNRNISLEGIDLTPPILAEQWKQNPEKRSQPLVEGCSQLTYLRKLELPEAILTNASLVCADLRGAKLQGARLWDAKLQGASLRGAKLQGADLWGAKLQGANLRRADLDEAILWEAKLQGADLRDAKLQGASLRDAKLQGANLSRAKLQGANLRDAKLQGADLWRADLRRIKRIECSELMEARDWETAYRDEELACGAERPIPPAPAPAEVIPPCFVYYGWL